MVAVLTSKPHVQHRRTVTASYVEPTEPATRAHQVGCEPLLDFPGRPGGLTVDADETVYLSISDPVAAIWQISLDGSAKPLSWQTARHERLYSPAGIGWTPDGSLVLADATAHRICSRDADGSIRTLAGGVSGYRDGPAAQTAFRFPRSVAIGGDGDIFVADTGNDRIRKISADGQVGTVAGSIYDYGDGPGSHARFRRPSGLAIDRDGVLYVADTGNNAIRRLTPDGQVTTVAGGPAGGHGDGPGLSAGLRWPVAIAVADDGHLWVADYGNSNVRLISPTGDTCTMFEITGLGWPTAVAALPNHRAVVAGSTLDDRHDRRGCLMVIGDGC